MTPRPDDDLDDLPPLDGDGDDDDAPEADLLDLDAESSDPLDDSTSEDDPVDPDDIDGEEGGKTWIGEAADAPDLELGDTGLVMFDDSLGGLEDAADPTVSADDVGFGETGEKATLDSGDEGPLDPDEQLRDEDLPAFDADEEGEPDEAGFWDPKVVADEQLGVAWASQPWPRVGAPLALVRATALACVTRGVLVAARSDGAAAEAVLVQADLEGSVEILDTVGLRGDVEAIAVDGPRIAVAADGGRLSLASRDTLQFERAADLPAVAAVQAVGGCLWVQTRSGALLVSTDGGRTFARCPVAGFVTALSGDGAGGIAALIVSDAGQPAALVRGAADGTVAREPIEAPAAAIPGVFAVRGGLVAYAAATSGAVRRGADGTWRSFPWEGRITAMAFVDGAGTLIAATYSESDDATALVCLDGAGHPAVVARVGAPAEHPDVDGQTIAVAPDDSRGVVWVAGGFGVAAFAVSAQGMATKSGE
jgi:hypothetical protein